MAWKRQYFDSVNENKIEHSSCLLLTKWYYCYTSYMVLLLYYSECFAKRPFLLGPDELETTILKFELPCEQVELDKFMYDSEFVTHARTA